MSTAGGATRWWENYLVRYLMPSIAGAVIVNWLASVGGQDFKQLLLIEVGNSGIQTPTLVLLFLYGNLFCYVASYPILGFHVTRVIDFENERWCKNLWDGYICTFILALAVLLACIHGGGASCLDRMIPFLLVLLFTCLQLYRIYLALVDVTFAGLRGNITKVFAYTYAISRRRGVVEEQENTKQTNIDQGDKVDEEKEWQKISDWRREIIDSYRHMREHGNSAFIFLLELILAGLCFLILTGYKSESASDSLSIVGVLFALWAFPAIFIHFIGQHIERRFSWYDRKVNQTETNKKDGA